MKVLVLGVGMQGKAALHDLASSLEVGDIVAADVDIDMLESYVQRHGWAGRVRCERLDASDPAALSRLLSIRPDVAIDLLPTAFIDRVASAAIEHGVHLVNTFYVSKRLKDLDENARRRGVTILPEFGLDPGIDLVMLGEAHRSLDTIEEIHSYGAGIPELEAADNPLRYKVSWTFDGVLETYRRPARAIRQGTLVEFDRTHLFSSENVHQVDVAGLGALEAYPNDDVVQYVEALGLDVGSLRAAGRYTMRWPGHCAFWKSLVDLHLLDLEPVIVDGRPVDRARFLAAAVGPHIQYAPGERDVVVVRVDVAGRKAGKPCRLRYELLDRRDLATGLSAMSRTVGFTASIGASMVARGMLPGPGVLSPVRDVPYQPMVDELGRRGIRVSREEIGVRDA
ncbi:MAG: saccharopine dehydrogenase NADP-binding domain-containing protein [Candidatus Eiseniibacteriota bacterium]|nr:MAG: saccharopine dehydrogenase NADP-binding domain-containing protein [Candidatus Eisenbacteria bacterium]